VNYLDALLARLKMVMDTHPDDGGQVLLADGVEDCYEAITRLRANLARAEEKCDALAAEIAALKAHDLMAQMWAALAEHQEQADKDGHGESWRKMCEQRTVYSTYEARTAACHAAQNTEETAAEGKWAAAWAMAWAAEDAFRSVVENSNFRRNVEKAIDAIRRATEVQNG
jgi:hypothetical protein